MERIKYLSAAFAAAIIWGFFPIPLRHLKPYSAEQILYFRILISLIITWLLILLLQRNKLKADISYLLGQNSKTRKKIIGLTLLAGLLITGNWFAFIYAINNISLKSAAFAYMVCPLITALGGFFIIKEKLSQKKFIAIGIALISISILASGSLTEVMWSVFIASLYAFYLIIQRVLPYFDKLNVLGMQLMISFFLMLPLFFYNDTDVPLNFDFWLNMLLISVVFTILPLFLSLYALIGIPSSTMGIIIYINPIIAFSVAFFYFHEGINATQVLAYYLLLIAVVIFNSGIISETFNKKYKKAL